MAPNGADPAPATRRPPGGPAKGDRRRQAIVEAVERLLREQTIAQLSVESIAAEAGISRSGFYFYFESKYQALGEALTAAADEMTAAAEAFYDPTGDDPATYVPRSLSAVNDLWERHADLMIAIVDAAHSDAGARALWEAWLDQYFVANCEVIDAGRARGEIPPAPPDSMALSRTLMLMNQAVFDDLQRRSVSVAERTATITALTHVWLSAVWGL